MTTVICTGSVSDRKPSRSISSSRRVATLKSGRDFMEACWPHAKSAGRRHKGARGARPPDPTVVGR
eukprot:11200372-Lingulodinium_polyedra.AAC.1